MPPYEYQCTKGHSFEAVQSVIERHVTRCSVCMAKARRIISQPKLLRTRGVYVFDRQIKDDVLRSRPSSLKSMRKREIIR